MKFLTNWVIVAVTAAFALLFPLNTYTYAWHGNLGIDACKAAELYKTNPNDPAMVQWKNALQSAINHMDKCFDIETVTSCEPSMSMLINNCNSHLYQLLGCDDARLPQYPSILKNGQIKAEAELKKG